MSIFQEDCMNQFKKVLVFLTVLLSCFYVVNSFADTTAKEFQGISTWYNSDPITLESLKGKIILVDFWSRTCPNCINSIPSVKKWYNTYSKKGLVIIGIHVPLGGQRNIEAIKKAIEQHGIKYPVAVDNQLNTTHMYGVHQLPAFYLIDKNGKIVYKSVGAGNYAGIEKNIEKLLAN